MQKSVQWVERELALLLAQIRVLSQLDARDVKVIYQGGLALVDAVHNLRHIHVFDRVEVLVWIRREEGKCGRVICAALDFLHPAGWTSVLA